MRARKYNLWLTMVTTLILGCGGGVDDADSKNTPTSFDGGSVPGSTNSGAQTAPQTNNGSVGSPGDTSSTTDGAGDDRDRNTNGRPPRDTNRGGTNTGGTNAGGTNNMGTPPVGGDTDEPVAIDIGSDPSTPGSYKGLPLALTDNGAPSVTAVNQKIGVVCIGMSNGNRECDDYIDKIARNWTNDINGEVVVVNCAVGGNAIEKWSDPANDGPLWDSCMNTKIPGAGLSVDQVRVVWHKAANQFTTMGQGVARPFYPDADADYFVFYDNLTAFADRVTVQFPNLQAVYTTSRSYGGFSDRIDRGEPLSYEEGHALNSWLADNPSVAGVWFGWGPYIWAPDCATGDVNGSGVCYVRSDYVGDAIHPGAGAKDKISQMLHERFLLEAWYQP